MLDHPQKTASLIETLTAAAPFEVELTPEAVAHLRPGHIADIAPRQTVLSVSYAGDMGGIMCRIKPEGLDKALFFSLTHLRVRAVWPHAAAVQAYQKHRVKKLKKQQSMGY